MAPKSVLITGCSQGGIGDALAREFHARGLTVFAAARNAAKVAHLAGLPGVETVELDVTDEASVRRAAEAVAEATGGRGLDVLVNNAGVTQILPFADTPLADMRWIVETNLIGVFAVTQAFLPLVMKARGTVANVGSVNQVFCLPFSAPYNASKAALAAFSKTLAAEMSPFGVRVVHIMSGAVKTNMTAAEGDKMPEDSLYEPLRDMIEGRRFIDEDRLPPAEKYARNVVNDLLGNPSTILWRGGGASIARFLDAFAPTWLVVSSSAVRA